MKQLASITALILSACAYVSTGVAVPPPSDFVDTEAATNVDAQALTEAFRHGCFAVGLTGLGMVFLVAVGIWLCRQACRQHTSCQGQPVFRRLALLAFGVLAFTVGGTKTNGVNNLPQQQLMMPRPTLQTGTSAGHGRTRSGCRSRMAGFSRGGQTTSPASRSFPMADSGRRHSTRTPSRPRARRSRSYRILPHSPMS